MAEEFLNQISAKCSVIIIGAGQAGLSIAHSLQKKGIKPLILEKNYVGFSWKEQRWDSFCLVTPNWQCTLPDYQYSGKDPNGFMDKENIVKYLKKYSEFVKADILEGIEVKHLVKKNEKFFISTNRGNFEADQVVIATGAYHVPNRHPHSERLPTNILQIDAREYKNANSLPDGPVLVVGSGQSGCQIAEDLFFEKRKVHLSVGSAPRSPRRYRGRDVVDWLDRMGYYSMPIGEHDDPKSVRNKTNHYLTGRDNGREIDLRKRAKEVTAKIPPIEPSICNHIFLCLQISLISLIGSMAPLTVVPRVATIANIFLFSIEHLSKEFLRSFISIRP